MDALDYGVCYLYGKEDSGEFYTMETHNMCLEELNAHGFIRKEDDWCFERYNCPRFAMPDESGNVIPDYGIAPPARYFPGGITVNPGGLQYKEVSANN